jgi:hypothetical protein
MSLLKTESFQIFCNLSFIVVSFYNYCQYRLWLGERPRSG